MDTLLDHLRLATRSQHQALHQHPLLLACQENRLDIHDYGNILSAFYYPWQLLEPCINKISITDLQICLKERFRLLNNDLQVLGVNKSHHKPLLCLTTADACLGVAYVLVGSSLGARILASHIKTALPNASMYYMSQSATAAGWPLLARHLQKHVANQHPETITMAQNTFNIIEQMLNAYHSDAEVNKSIPLACSEM